MKTLLIFITSIVFLSGCTQPVTPSPLPPTEITGSITSPTSVPVTQTSVPTLSPTSLPATPVQIAVMKPVIHAQPGFEYETVLQLPVGEGGIAYRGLGVNEMQITGPNALAVLPDGSFIIANPVDNNLLRYHPDGTLLAEIDLYTVDIVNITDLVAAATELYLLEISFNVSPERYRVSRLTFDGELLAQYDLPLDRRFENGLYGFGPPGSDGEILLEFYGEAIHYYLLTDLAGNSGELPGIPAYGRTYAVHSAMPPAPPSIQVDALVVESPMTIGGLIKPMAVNPDGTFYVFREDMVADFPVIQGDITIHLVSSAGDQIGAARYPLGEWLYFVQRYAALGPDGEVYALLPRTETLDILRLNFYPRLEPLIPDAAEPEVGRTK